MSRLDPRATADDRFDYEERAAIMQHVGGLPPDMAERLAAAQVNRKIEARNQSAEVATGKQ